MKNKLNLFLIMLPVMMGCQKDSLMPINESFVNQNGKSITSFTNLTTESVNRQDIPYFKSLEPHDFGLTIIGKNADGPGFCGFFGRFEDNVGNKLDVGTIKVGDYQFSPNADKMYYTEDVYGAEAVNSFGRMTEVVVPGDNVNVNAFKQSMQFPAYMDIESPIRNQFGVVEMSRNEGYEMKYVTDSQNNQPLVLMVSWTATGDQLNRDYKYSLVTNYFIIDEGDRVILDQKSFENMPTKAQLISCSLWRGNAMVDNQDLFVLAYTSGGFGGIVLMD